MDRHVSAPVRTQVIASQRSEEMEPHELKDRYYGSLAETYDEVRQNTPLWTRENDAMREILSHLDAGSTVIDVPVGTARFLPFYRDFGLRPTGIDISQEMLHSAGDKREGSGVELRLARADIRSLPFTDDAFDTAVCMRFLNWLGADDVQASIVELGRIAKQRVIFGLRTYIPIRALRPDPSSIKTHLLQLKLRFYQFRKRETFIYHEARTLQSALERSNMRLMDRIPIKTKKGGFDYSIYVAQVNDRI